MDYVDELAPLVTKFRSAIDSAKAEGIFRTDLSFCSFPRGCCGDTADLLAQFLLEHSIITWYVGGSYYPDCDNTEDRINGFQSHAWLTTSDPIKSQNYLIIDITGDQFRLSQTFDCYDQSVYIGGMDHFHSLFEFDNNSVRKFDGLDSLFDAKFRLNDLYQIITAYIKDF